MAIKKKISFNKTLSTPKEMILAPKEFLYSNSISPDDFIYILKRLHKLQNPELNHLQSAVLEYIDNTWKHKIPASYLSILIESSNDETELLVSKEAFSTIVQAIVPKEINSNDLPPSFSLGLGDIHSFTKKSFQEMKILEVYHDKVKPFEMKQLHYPDEGQSIYVVPFELFFIEIFKQTQQSSLLNLFHKMTLKSASTFKTPFVTISLFPNNIQVLSHSNFQINPKHIIPSLIGGYQKFEYEAEFNLQNNQHSQFKLKDMQFIENLRKYTLLDALDPISNNLHRNYQKVKI